MTPAVALTSQSLDPVQAFAAWNGVTITVNDSDGQPTSDASVPYTGAIYTVDVAGAPEGTTPTVTINDDPVANVTIQAADTYVIKAVDPAESSNSVEYTFTITEAQVSVAPNSNIANNGKVEDADLESFVLDNLNVTGGPASAQKSDMINLTGVSSSVSGNTQTITYTLGAKTNYAIASTSTLTAGEHTMAVDITPSKTNLETLSTLTVSYTGGTQPQVLKRNETNTIVLAPGTTQANALADLANQISVANGENPLTVDDDYTISTAAGAITITAAENSSYTGWVQYPFQFVYGFSADNVTIKGNSSFPYDGAAHVPTLEVIDPATNKPTTDYTVAYQVQDAKKNWVAVSGQPTNAGSYRAVVTCGDYTQTVTKDFTITALNLAEPNFATVSKVADIAFTGDVLTIPDVTVTVNFGTKTNPKNVTLVKGVDYTVAVVDADDNTVVEPTEFEAVGNYKLQITGKGNYGLVTVGDVPSPIYTDTFAVTAPSIANATVEVTNKDKLIITKAMSENAEKVKPLLKVTLNGKELKSPADYTFTPDEIGTPGQNIVLTLTGNGTTYTGTKKVTVDVLKSVDFTTSALTNPTVKLQPTDLVNNAVEYGAAGSKTASITVMDGQSELTEGVDYKITYGANTGAGPAAGTYTIEGIGNGWGGTVKGTYSIKGTSAVIKNLKVKPVTFNGAVQDPADFITFEVWALNDATKQYEKVNASEYGYEIRTNADFKDAGTYTYSIQLTDCPYDVSGSEDSGVAGAVASTGNITIQALDLAALTIKSSQEMYLITATKNAQGDITDTPAVKPEFTITLNGAEYKLTANDYTASYEDAEGNTANLASTTGSITAILTGDHNFTGENEVTFDVYNNIENLFPAEVAAVTYNGKAQTPAIALYTTKAAAAANTATGATFVPEANGMGNAATTNYTVAYEDNINAGTGKIIVTGTPNATNAFAGTLEIPFTINKAAATIAVADIADVTYTGSAIMPEPKATITAGAQTVASTFAYSYANNVNAGTATVTVVPTGVGANYDVAATTKSFKINAANMSAVTYAGDTTVDVNKQPTIKLTYNGKELVSGTDFDVTETPVTSKAGKATLKVTGKGNFTGVKTIEITVKDASTPVNPDKPTTTEGWKHNATGWWYETGEGSYVTSAWKEINGNWYYFNKSGYMMTGWQKINGTWYYLNKKGEGTEGAMVSNAWKKINGTWYYFAKSGAMQTGWQKINGAWYYMAASGAMQTGWVKDGNTWYYLLTAAEGTEGKMVANQWKQINGSWFYFYASGAMAANTWVGNYWVDANGYWVR